jgi:iron complex transport system substrate-binding protein
MRGLRKLGAVMMSLCIGTSLFTGCTNAEKVSAPQIEETQAVQEAESETKQKATEEVQEKAETEPRTIVDQAGNEIVLPDKVERVVISSLWPLPSVYCLFQGSGEGLVGMHPASKSAAEFSLLPQIAPEVYETQTSFIENGEMNIEELLKLQPDIVFGSNAAEYEMAAKAGITYVQFNANPKGDGNAIESVGSWLKLLGEIFEKEDRAEEIMAEGYKALDEIQTVTKTIAEEEKVRALMIFKYAEGRIEVAGKGHFGDFWITSSGAVNVAGEIQGTKEVNMEQIYKWNPDKVYITNFSSHMPEDLYDNIIQGHDWSSVKAVQDKEVHKIPLGMYRWYPPSSDTPLMLKWLAKTNYPELFEHIQMDEEVKAYYQKFYGMELTAEQIKGIFTPSRDAAKGV